MTARCQTPLLPILAGLSLLLAACSGGNADVPPPPMRVRWAPAASAGKPLGPESLGAHFRHHSPHGAISPDGRTIAASGDTPSLWELESGALTELAEPAIASCRCLLFAPDGRKLAGLIPDGRRLVVLEWPVRSVVVEVDLPFEAERIAFEGTGDSILASGREQFATVDLTSGLVHEPVAIPDPDLIEAFVGPSSGEWLAIGTGLRPRTRLLRLRPGTTEWAVESALITQVRQDRAFLRSTLTEGRDLGVAIDPDAGARLLGFRGTPPTVLVPPERLPSRAVLARNGAWAAVLARTAAAADEESISVFAGTSRHPALVIDLPVGESFIFDFVGGNSELCVASETEGSVVVYALPTGERRFEGRLGGCLPRSLASSANGRTILAIDEDGLGWAWRRTP